MTSIHIEVNGHVAVQSVECSHPQSSSPVFVNGVDAIKFVRVMWIVAGD
jgi:hypothetical protein